MEQERNELYPVFLKVSKLKVLIVGGGSVGLEKLGFLLKSSPGAQVAMVARTFLQEIEVLAEQHGVELIQGSYHKSNLDGQQLVIAATDDLETNLRIHSDCKSANILINVADNPDYCDFYMGGIVTKGNLKLAISTNGKSPTAAKRLRQFFEEVLPEDMEELLANLNNYRKTIKGDFGEKVRKLNALTRGMLDSEPNEGE
jgi:precorrin-2 dehydrogenase/sirohydrochlorin ferrochelatase